MPGSGASRWTSIPEFVQTAHFGGRERLFRSIANAHSGDRERSEAMLVSC